MLKCRDVAEQADFLLAGDLGFRQRLMLHLHLMMCRHCQRYLRQLRRLVRAIPYLHGRASDEEIERVLRRLRSHTPDSID